MDTKLECEVDVEGTVDMMVQWARQVQPRYLVDGQANVDTAAQLVFLATFLVVGFQGAALSPRIAHSLSQSAAPDFGKLKWPLCLGCGVGRHLDLAHSPVAAKCGTLIWPHLVRVFLLVEVGAGWRRWRYGL